MFSPIKLGFLPMFLILLNVDLIEWINFFYIQLSIFSNIRMNLDVLIPYSCLERGNLYKMGFMSSKEKLRI